MLRRIERLLQPTAASPEDPPPQGLLAFYWHHARQARLYLVALFVTGSIVALLDVSMSLFIGRLMTLVSQTAPADFLKAHWPELAGMAVVVGLLRPLGFMAQNLVTNQILTPGLTNLTRWQNHWHVIRQSWSFFQNDFAGRIAGRIIQTGASLRESVVAATNSVWHVLVFGTSAVALLAAVDARMAAPLLVWSICFVALLRFVVPEMRDRSRRNSEARSALTGRIVDSYSNILTVKLFARARDEDAFVREALDAHTGAFRRQQRMMTVFGLLLSLLNGALLAASGAVALLLWTAGSVSVGMVAMALQLAWQLNAFSWSVALNVTSIFEAVGSVQDGMRSIAAPRQMPDPPEARPLKVSKGEIEFDTVSFGYGPHRTVLRNLNLSIAGGERVGLIGHSGAGKSTLVNLLLHFFDVGAGVIRIDGQDIAKVTQESLRSHIAMVTQDTSLLHRSIRDNIRYGRPEATDGEIRAAAEAAHALNFIERLEDGQGRRGFDSLVGERGVKLSGGQRQRIAIARVILKNAPILILDEATSALDSEVEAAIQEQLSALMEGRTVVAIAHRLSTIARMDRLIVLAEGEIVEQGSHAALLAAGGPYARSWQRQSGGFADAARDSLGRTPALTI